MHELVDMIIPVSVCVVLPVLVVFFVTRSGVKKNEQKMNVLMKAIENGVEVDPSLLVEVERKKDPKVRMLNNLRTGVFFMLVGLIGLALYLVPSLADIKDLALFLWVLCIPLGVCFLVWCYVGRKLKVDQPE